MPLVPITNIGSIGIVKDMPAHQLPPEAWSEGSNIRMKDGGIERYKGHELIYNPPSVAPLFVFPVRTETSLYYWLYTSTAAAYCIDADSGVHTNLTRALGPYTANADLNWGGTLIGGIPVLNNGVDTPQMWFPRTTATKLIELSNWPASTTCAVIKSYKQYLIALDITKTGVRYPHMVKWSHVADPGTLPVTWNPADPTKDAGEYELKDDAGFLIDMLQLRDTNVLYKEDTVWGMQFIGGIFVFRFWKMFPEMGLLARRCVHEFSGQHFMVTDQYDIVLHNGQSVQSLANGRIQKWLAKNSDPVYRTRNFIVSKKDSFEMWYCFVESGATFPSKALIWNWKDGTFAIKDLPAVATIDYGYVKPTVGLVNTWDPDTQTWDADTTIWNLAAPDRSVGNLLSASSNNNAFYYTDYTEQLSGVNFSAYIEREGIIIVGRDSLGHPQLDATQVKLLSEVWPQFDAVTGTSIDIYVGAQYKTTDAVIWSGPFPFVIGVDRKINCLVSGVYLAIRFQSTASIPWRLTAYSLNIQTAGRY